MTTTSAASRKTQEADGAFQEIEKDRLGGARMSVVDDREVVHLLKVMPPAGGGTCTCDVCGLVFQSKAATWINNARQHQDDSYHGRYKSCRPRTP